VIGGFVRGLSMRDIESLCEEAGLAKISKSSVSRVCAELHERFEAFCRRSLYDVNLVVLFLDAIYLPVRPSGPKEGVICAWGITETGARELVSVRLGMREAKEDWLELGGDLIARGVEVLKKLGCEVREISLPSTEFAIASYYIIATAEASSNLARYDGVRYGLRVEGDSLLSMYRKTRGAGFGAEVKRRIVLGTYVLSAGYYDAYYLKGQKVRSLIARDFRDAFTKVDAIVTPTSPVPAFKLGERTADPLQMYLADIYTVTGSLAGVPGISVPCGKICGKLPVGLQIFAPPFGEGRALQLAHAFEQAGGATL